MKNQTLLCIVPRLPPAVSGLGDYALLLAKKLKTHFSINTEFLLTDPDGSQISLDGFSIHNLKQQSSSELVTLLQSLSTDTLMLHYVGYGYARRGVPLWLAKGLEQWKAQNSQAKLLLMMHEIYAFGPPWTSPFWLFPIQKNIAKRLIQISDKSLTSKSDYAFIMEKLAGLSPSSVISLPVFSNVGEPLNPKPLIERKPRLIIFGGKGPRQRVYQESVQQLISVVESLSVQEIFDIGPPLDKSLPDIDHLKIQVKGTLPPEEISALLLESRFGFINYPSQYLSKSGIFAAYCAHGLLPLVTPWKNQKVDGAKKNTHFLITNELNEKTTIDQQQKIADQALSWYNQHNLTKQSEIYYELLNKI